MKKILLTIAFLSSVSPYVASAKVSLCASKNSIKKGYECTSMNEVFCLIQKKDDQYELIVGNSITGITSREVINKTNYLFDHTDESLIFHKKELVGKDFPVYSTTIVVDEVYKGGSIEKIYEDSTSMSREYRCTKL